MINILVFVDEECFFFFFFIEVINMNKSYCIVWNVMMGIWMVVVEMVWMCMKLKLNFVMWLLVMVVVVVMVGVGGGVMLVDVNV